MLYKTSQRCGKTRCVRVRRKRYAKINYCAFFFVCFSCRPCISVIIRRPVCPISDLSLSLSLSALWIWERKSDIVGFGGGREEESPKNRKKTKTTTRKAAADLGKNGKRTLLLSPIFHKQQTKPILLCLEHPSDWEGREGGREGRHFSGLGPHTAPLSGTPLV